MPFVNGIVDARFSEENRHASFVPIRILKCFTFIFFNQNRIAHIILVVVKI